MVIANCIPLVELSDFDIRRFWKKVDKNPGHGPNGDCWPWMAGRDRKYYGKFQIKKRQFTASRVSLFLATGIDPYPFNALHECDWPPCCRPDHLYAGTQIENVRKAWATGRAKSNLTAERRRGEMNPCAKLTEDQVLEIRKRYWFGNEAQRAIAADYGITQTSLYCIVNGKTWAHVELIKSEERKHAMPNGKFSTRPVLSREQVLQIRSICATGTFTNEDIARHFNISGHTVGAIRRFKIHKEVR